VRKVREAQARTDAAQARDRLAAAEDEVAYRERRLQGTPAPGTGPALAVAAALAARRSMAEDTAVARGLAAAAREVSAARTEILVGARAQRRGVDLLRERWSAELAAERDREAVRQTDEITTARFARRQRPPRRRAEPEEPS
jgi:flagellar export protein FliJ